MEWTLVMAYIVGALTSGLFSIANTWYSNKLKKKGKKRTQEYLYSIAQYNYNLNRTLFCIRNKLNASNIFLARFHNGGQFINGMKIDKFSITNESPSNNTKALQKDYENVMFTRYSKTISNLLYTDKFYIPDTEKQEGFPLEVNQRGYQSLYLFLIKGIDQIPAGFVAILFENKTMLESEQKQIVESYHNQILNYVNHTGQDDI